MPGCQGFRMDAAGSIAKQNFAGSWQIAGVEHPLQIDIGQKFVQVSAMYAVTYSYARENLKAVLDKAVNDRAPIAIARQRGEGAVIISESEWNSIEETLHLLSSPENAARLLEAVRGFESGEEVPPVPFP